MLNGIPVQLLQKTAGTSEGGETIYNWVPVTVDNVLVAPLSEVDSTQALTPEGRRALYHLAIPKADTHRWEGQMVQFWGCTWSVIGIPTMGIDHLIPGPWNKKVVVELYRTATPDIASLWADKVTLRKISTADDDDGYAHLSGGRERTRTCIFTQGVDREEYAQDDKTGVRRSATVELWAEDYDQERALQHAGIVYDIIRARPSGRGTILLELREVWR